MVNGDVVSRALLRRHDWHWPEREATLWRPAMPSLRLVHIGSFPPRACGIATYTEDVAAALASAIRVPDHVVAVEDGDESLSYGRPLLARIQRDDEASYRAAAAAINASGATLVNLQHEYGLFGGDHGRYLLALLERLELPVVTTLHTTLPNPEVGLRDVTRRIARHSARLVVLARAGAEILTSDYGISPQHLDHIPHGVPPVPWGERYRRQAKADWAMTGRTVLATFGLIGRGKGIDDVIEALPRLVAADPSLLYVVAGRTHPGVVRHEGETYRAALEARVAELGLRAHVRFENRYLSRSEVVRLLQAAEVYLMAYHNPDQVVSGTLAYALGAGRAVVATPFTHAREVLAHGAGILVPFADSSAIAAAVECLITRPELRARIERTAYETARSWQWPNIGLRYAQLFREAAYGMSRTEPVPRPAGRAWAGRASI
jgi:glycosyltransferase involved in cell wall biosynthesis